MPHNKCGLFIIIMTIYQEKGYKNRHEYLMALSKKYGINIKHVRFCADVVGTKQLFNGGLDIMLQNIKEAKEREIIK